MAKGHRRKLGAGARRKRHKLLAGFPKSCGPLRR